MNSLVLDNFEIQDNIEELIRKEDRFSIEGSRFWNESLIIHAIQKENRQACIIKIPIRDTSRKECQIAYDVKREIGDLTHLVRIIRSEPLQYGNYYGVLMEKADCNLRNYFEDIDSVSDVENHVLDIMLQVSLGLHELHKKGYRHRDIKPTNMLRYDEKTWVLSDFGTATDRELTYSHQSVEEYSAYELLEQLGRGGQKRYSFDTDIFAMGVIMYQCLNPSHKTLYRELNHDNPEKLLYTEFVIRKIDKLKVSDRTKYFLRRLLGVKAPDKLPQDKTWKDYRYKSIDMFTREVHGEPVPEDEEAPEATSEYQRFKQKHDEYVAALESAEQNRDGKKWNTVNYKTIDMIVSLRDEVEQLADNDVVKLAPDRNELISSATEIYLEIRDGEEKILQEQIKKGIQLMDKDSHVSCREEFLRPIYEIMFLWGPPFTESKRETGEKARYTLKETLAQNTHYHRQFG